MDRPHWLYISSAWWKKPTRRFSVGKADTSVFRSKSRHVDFCFKKWTSRFLVEKADTSILVEKWHSSDPSLNYYYSSWDPLTLYNHISYGSFCTFLYVFSDIVSSIIYLSNWSFLLEKKMQARRVRFFNEKSTCPLFEAKIDVSAFRTESRRVGFFHQTDDMKFFSCFVFLPVR